MDFKFDVNKVLEDLAHAFNTSVEYIYPLLVKQAIIDGIITLIVLMIGFIGIALSIILVGKSKKNFRKKDYRSSWEWDYEGIPYIISLAVSSLLTFIGFALFFKYGITALFNPEYHMIQKIIDQLQ